MASSLLANLLTFATVLLNSARCDGTVAELKAGSPLRFTHHLYNTTIDENSGAGSYVETPVKMGLEMADAFWEIKYVIVSGDESGYFQAEDVKVGDFCFLRIKTQHVALLNREVRDAYTLTVEATESTQELQAKTKVFVQILDTNDLKPLFDPSSYSVAIPEDTPLQSSLVRVRAADADMGSNAEFYYSFTIKSHPFVVDPFSGTIRLLKRLNHTRSERYELTVLAEDRTKRISGIQKFGNVAKVSIKVQKAAAASPVVKPPANPSISADGTVTINVHVEAGLKPVKSLRIIGGDPHKNFEVIPEGLQGSNFQIVSTKKIVWSQSPFGLNLSLQAQDISSPSLMSPIAKIHIPAFHYRPKSFLEETYILVLSEMSPPKTFVAKVSVDSGTVTYSIKTNPDSSKFKINPKSGIIITRETFDYEDQNHYEFDVLANGGEAKAHVVVKIADENDNSPEFTPSSYQATVDENSPIGSSLLKIKATDKDDGKHSFVTYAIANADLLPFAIDPFTGVIFTTEHMDFELMKRWYHLRVWASDSGEPFSRVSECTVTITLNNVNDNVPLFERVGCNVTVPPDLAVGRTIVEMSAIDLDELQQLRYIIESGNEFQIFAINSVSGEVILKRAIPPGVNSFDLQVVASDGEHRSEASVVRVTVTSLGDEPTVSCQETFIFKQLTDKLIESVKPIWTEDVDYTSSDIHITNRHSPIFDAGVPSSLDLSEDYPLNSTVVRLDASDHDTGFNAMLTYAISGGNEDGCFVVDTFSGDLRLLCGLDRESKEFYILNISTYDLGTPQRSAWKFLAVNVLDVNDNPPLFDQPRHVIHIPENTKVDTVVFTARATDSDIGENGKVKYTLLTSIEIFRIEEVTGEVVVMAPLDRESSPRHDVWIEARDQSKLTPPMFATLHLVVVLQDVNDNPPTFVTKVYRVKIPEDLPVGTLLVWVESVDSDLGGGGLITYNLKNTESGIFRLDSSTGALTLERELDFERRASYNLTVRAVDHGPPRSLSSSCFVEIQVLDVNENLHPPLFSEFVYEAIVTEDAVAGTAVLTVTATDKDVGGDGVIRYRIHDGSGLGVFAIDEETGVIRTTGPLDREKVPHYWLSIVATDLGTEPRASWTHVYMDVLDINDNAPELSQPIYFASVPENVEAITSIVLVAASDADASSQGRLSFHITESHRTYFDVDHKTGLAGQEKDSLQNKASEAKTVVTLVPAFSIIISILIATIPPLICLSNYFGNRGNLWSDRPSFHTEQRHISNPILRHFFSILLTGNINNIFSIDQVSGSISMSKPLDILHQDPFHLTVKATDQGFPQRSDICSVHIHIRISDHSLPVFHDDEYLAEISERSGLGTPVVAISASSPAAVNYDIESGNPNGTFHIDRYTGMITVRKLLDFEMCSSYTLNVSASTSSGAMSRTAVYIYVMDENDNTPIFAKREYIGQIGEAAHTNSLVMSEDNMPLVVQASDVDRDANALLVYEILEEEAAKVFRIDTSTGAISLAAPLDFEIKAEYHFNVQARDSGKPSLYATQPAKVAVHVLDVNDYPPQFTTATYESSVIFPPVLGAEVTRVVAHDADSAISYSIAEGNLDGAFSIHPATGVIIVSNVLRFKPFYQLVVSASDGLHEDSAIVRVNITNVTESGLSFEQKTYSVSVSENLSSVKTLAVLKPRGCYLNEPLSYSLLNPMGRFSISRTSGVMETTGVPFDREDTDAYDVVVILQDTRMPRRTATALVKVFIDDVNDNPPQFLNLPFSMTMSEDTEPGDVLYQVTARDIDLGENGSIVYSMEEDYDLFRIDPTIGDVSIQRPLDFDTLSKYVLTILAMDEGVPSHMTEAQLSIQVRNRTNPVFQTLLYPLKVPESVPPFTTILHVQARNPEGYRLIYNLVEENASKHFHIDFKTGALTVTNSLDYESQNLHVLTVRATDSVSGAFSEASIEVEDVNDNAPFFYQQKYTTSIAEGLPIGSSVLQLSASDLDSGRNKDLTFHMVRTEGNETDFFDIDHQSGLIFLKQVLDHESVNRFRLKIQVVDNGSIALSGETVVLVNVTDVNDNPPDFVSSHFQASLDESAKCGHIVIKIQASDPDIADANHLKYKILSGNEDRYFNINETSGIISFSNICKRNLDPYYNLTVAVSDGVFQKSAPVNIDMINSNRHRPYFRQSTYEAEVTENAEAGTRVIQLAAIDPDDGPYGSVDYTIINKLADEKFAINANGQIVTTQPLDRENPDQRVIAIKVMAKDGGGKVAFCTVKIILADDNDNVPQFKASEYHVAIKSTVNKGSPVIQIMAYDADDGKNADITYTVDEAEGATEDIIEINPFTGVVSVKESLLDMENRIFTFKVKARDGNFPFYNSTVPVRVKVLPPEIPLPKFVEPLYTFSTAEDTPVGTEIGSVRADSNMPLIYSLVDGNTVESNRDKVFSLDKESGTLLLEKTMDHERTKWYHIDVLAQGNHNGTDVASMVSVSIQVRDVNDNQPVFDANPYRAYLAENMPAGTTVIQVTANDPDTDSNGLVTYSLESLSDDDVNITDLFSIDGDTGWIVTVREADCEASRLHRFHVLATDHGGDAKLSSSVLVEVTVTDENDSPPAFSVDAYRGSVAENSHPGRVIVSMTTTDADVSLENRLVTCYITDGDPLGQFAVIHRDEGEWGLITKEPLDREANAAYALTITATDGKFQSPINVHVDVLDENDNTPQCQQLVYSEALMENSPTSTFVLKVSALDADDGPNALIFFTLHGPDADQFHLDHVTGELFTLAVLDRELVSEYKMVARGTDGGGRSCQVDISLRVLDMNDNAPLFSSSHYHVSVYDNTTRSTPVAAVYAHDADTGQNSEVRYTLLAGDDGYFSLDEFSGVLRLERVLGPDTPTHFQLKVKASDAGLPRPLHSVAAVTVDVVSLNDYQPIFPSVEYTARVPESLAVGSQVVSVSALDGDTSVVYSIASGNEDGHFLLDPKTGVLTLAALLDFEVSQEFYLSVEGTRGRSSLADVTIVVVNVSDVNDNAPVFSRGDYSAEISEERAPGSLVIKVTASDRDGPPNNNLLRYSIVSGDPLRQFAIDPRSGEISICAGLDREERTHYSLTVQAADEGDPPLSSAVLVTITVADANDNPPLFSQVQHSLLLQEGEVVGSGVLQLLVTDKDTPRNGPPFSFHIISGNEDRRFHVDQGGLLSLAAPLRRTSRAQHRLKIQVTDSGHPPLSSICVVTINVTEQSKYPPSVVPLEVFITTAGGFYANRVIGRLHTSDQDPQDVLSYALVSEDPTGHHFSVDRANGKIWVDKNLEEGSYALNVSVTDGRFSVWTAVKVHVWAATQRALDSGLTLRLHGISSEEFLADHWRGLQRSLAQALTFPRQELHLASLQMLPHTPILEILLIWRPQSGLIQSQHQTDIDSLGLDVVHLSYNGCLGDGCPPRRCRNTIHLAGDTMYHFSTARLAYITPRHRWESVCPCNESALRFSDEAYLKYVHGMDEDQQDFTVALSFRTFQQDGLLMLANGTDWGSLQVSGGHLHFSFSCGILPPSGLALTSPAVSDGRWHRVLLEVRATSLRLTLDRQSHTVANLGSPCRLMRSSGFLLFGNRRFRGCLEHLELNGEPIAVGDATEWRGPGRRRVFGVYECCSRAGPCDHNPCQNGGVCHEDTSGEQHCRCTGMFYGARCEQKNNPCVSEPCTHGRVCVPKEQGYICNCSMLTFTPFLYSPSWWHRCHNGVDMCSPNPCPSGFLCQVSPGSFHCDPLPQVSPVVGYVELMEIGASVLGLLLLVAIFVCGRKRYIQQRKNKKTKNNSNGYAPSILSKSPKACDQDGGHMELSCMTSSTNDLDHSPFRSLRPRSLAPNDKSHGPVVCSVAPNLPVRPPSSSDNDSVKKTHWDLDYEVYPADPDYFGRPMAATQDFPQFDIVEDVYSSSTVSDSRRNSRFGGFPFPLERSDRRAPLPPCYSNQNLDHFLDPNGVPLPRSQCPDAYTATNYYPAKQAGSLDGHTAAGYKRLSVRLSVAGSSYAEPVGESPNVAQPQTRPSGTDPHSYEETSMLESDFGSCEEVMF
uniref:FAT atypical cadherin 2 n=1 Tax=Hippocampus comes TaxID=109280 RepID=A0A3Q3DSY9_HIPCM